VEIETSIGKQNSSSPNEPRHEVHNNLGATLQIKTPHPIPRASGEEQRPWKELFEYLLTARGSQFA
jgi:hypothetical protein